MAGNQNEYSNDGREIKFAEDFPVVDIPIYPAGDGAALHMENDPDDPYQRDAIIQRKGRVNIRCDHKDIAHGYFSDEEDDLYSLIVVKFRFDPNGIAARIKEAHATIQFASMKRGKDPEVVAMYPEGSFFVEPTTQHEQVVDGVGANIGGSASGVEVGGELKHEKTIDRERVDFTKVQGSIEVLNRSFGRSNAVSWNFQENPTATTGVVSSLQGAILLKRANMDAFKATITLDATVDTVSKIRTLFKRDPKVDDVWYDPNKDPTNRLRKYDTDNLGAVDLKSLADVTFRTLLKDAVKEQ